MGLEVFDFIPELVPTNPEATDPVAQGDDHIRGIKLTLQNQWPLIGSDAVTRTALQMNDAALLSEQNIFTANLNEFKDSALRVRQNTDVDNGRLLYIAEDAVQRWNIGRASSAGGGLGQFQINRHSSSGVFQDTPLAINKDTGVVLLRAATTVAFPGLAFTGDENTGLVNDVTGRISYSAGGVLSGIMDAAQWQCLGSFRAANGIAATPGYGFTSNNDMGMYRESTNLLSFATVGVKRFSVGTGSVSSATGIPFNSGGGLGVAFPDYSFSVDNTTGMYRGGSGLLNFGVSGVELFSITAAGIIHNAVSSNQSGTAAAPGITFNTVRDMGVYAISTSVMGFSTGGLERARISSSGFDTAVPLLAQNENTITRPSDTQARTGWRYTNAANNPMWAIYLGTSPSNTLAFQRYNSSGTFQDIPLSINQAGGIIKMSTLPTSSAGLVAGELWRNPVSPGFVAII